MNCHVKKQPTSGLKQLLDYQIFKAEKHAYLKLENISMLSIYQTYLTIFLLHF